MDVPIYTSSSSVYELRFVLYLCQHLIISVLVILSVLVGILCFSFCFFLMINYFLLVFDLFNYLFLQTHTYDLYHTKGSTCYIYCFCFAHYFFHLHYISWRFLCNIVYRDRLHLSLHLHSIQLCACTLVYLISPY